MRAVNLLPNDSSQRKSIRKEDPAVVVGSALGAVVLVALIAGFLNVHSKVNADQKRLTAARSELAKLSEHKQAAPAEPSKSVKVVPIVPVPEVVSEQQPRLDALASAMSTRIAWDRILREFSLVLPSDVTLTSLALTAPVSTPGAPGGAGQGLTISGTTYSHDAVARLLSRLMLIPDLTGVTLGSSAASASAPGTPAVVTFAISAGVKGAPPPPAPPVTTPTDTTTTDTTTGATS